MRDDTELAELLTLSAFSPSRKTHLMKYTALVNADNNTVASGNSIAKRGNVRRGRLAVAFQMFVPTESADMHQGPSYLDMGVTTRFSSQYAFRDDRGVPA
jgi:hypothetical protein